MEKPFDQIEKLGSKDQLNQNVNGLSLLLKLHPHNLPCCGVTEKFGLNAFNCLIGGWAVKYSIFATKGTLKFQGNCGKFQSGGILVAIAITRVTHHRKTDHFKMTADLVFSACTDDYVHQRGVDAANVPLS